MMTLPMSSAAVLALPSSVSVASEGKPGVPLEGGPGGAHLGHTACSPVAPVMEGPRSVGLGKRVCLERVDADTHTRSHQC